jgi:hypothetical protein
LPGASRALLQGGVLLIVHFLFHFRTLTSLLS